jgi:hypothetical protein
LILIFGLSLLISAFLLFSVQFMVAKMLLPVLGGSAGVWQICQFFFQSVLLWGYGYSNWTAKFSQVYRQKFLHLGLICVGLAFLPINLMNKNPDNQPILWLISVLFMYVFMPIFIISASAPLLQNWFAQTDHPHSKNPYFLYAVSNLGSMLAVIGYPLVIEPYFSLSQQANLWAGGYGLLLILILVSALISQKRLIEDNSPIVLIHKPEKKQVLQWIFLAFIPSSLMLGVTNYITTDLASFPLLWSLPLALYLVSFILTFSLPNLRIYEQTKNILPLFLAPVIVISLLKLLEPIWLLLPLHLLCFFLTSVVIHGELVKIKPEVNYITNFYLWVAVGGVLGGLFNAIAAPFLFPNMLEYPLILTVTLLSLTPSIVKVGKSKAELLQVALDSKNLEQIDEIIKSKNPETEKESYLKFISFISIGILIGCLLVGLNLQLIFTHIIEISTGLIIIFALKYVFNLTKIRLITGIILVMLLSLFYIPSMGKVLYTERSFDGVNKVLYSPKQNYHILLHGTTIHGQQSLDINRKNQPLAYFYPTGPIGELFTELHQNKPPKNIAVMGLGVGSLAGYSQAIENWTFYELDPTVEKIAKNPEYFTFLQSSKGHISVILGDGRLKINQVRDHHYDLIVMDAFSSDAIPVHLVTKEAIQLYLSKLTNTGIIAINISNKHLNLEPVLSSLTNHLGLAGLNKLDSNITLEEKALGKTSSHWILLANKYADFGQLVNNSTWQKLTKNNSNIWTDNYSNIISTLKIWSK